MKNKQVAYFLLTPFLFISICILTLNAQDYHNKHTLSDSIRHELNKESIDTISLSQLLYQIRTKRIELGSDYKSLLTEYIKRSKDKEYLKGQMEALDRLGLQERFDENYEKAINYHMQSMQIALNLKDSMQLTYNFNNIAQAYRKQDLNGLAIRYFHSALKIQEQIGDTRGTYFTQNTLGATYLVQEEYKKALFYLHRSLEQTITHSNSR